MAKQHSLILAVPFFTVAVLLPIHGPEIAQAASLWLRSSETPQARATSHSQNNGGGNGLSHVFLPLTYAPAASSSKRYWETRDFAGGTLNGVVRTNNSDGPSLILNRAALQQGYDSAGRYNRNTYFFGRYTTPVLSIAFSEAIASWQAKTPQGTWLEVELRAQLNGSWSKWYSAGAWHQHDTPFRRHSFTGQADHNGDVTVDTLVLEQSASAAQARITLFTTDRTLSPQVYSLGVAFSNNHDSASAEPRTGMTSNLSVPKRSQMVFPDGGEEWCSPTSVSMVMAYWSSSIGNKALNQPVPTVVKGVWDYIYDGGGNWPFNTAYAASFGLEGKVVRLDSLAEVERWTAAGVPVIASIAYGRGELTGSPIPSSTGHLLVVRGFDSTGNVLTNDPAAASDAAVAITYKRAEFAKAWSHSDGTVYLIYPRGWSIPPSNGRW